MYVHRHDFWDDIGRNDDDWLIQMLNISDYLVVNWGPHYADDLIVSDNLGGGMTALTIERSAAQLEQSLLNFKQLLEAYWKDKPMSRVFWRASIGYHTNCMEAKEPYASSLITDKDPRIFGDVYHVTALYNQERAIVWPLLRK